MYRLRFNSHGYLCIQDVTNQGEFYKMNSSSLMSASSLTSTVSGRIICCICAIGPGSVASASMSKKQRSDRISPGTCVIEQEFCCTAAATIYLSAFNASDAQSSAKRLSSTGTMTTEFVPIVQVHVRAQVCGGVLLAKPASQQGQGVPVLVMTVLVSSGNLWLY